MERHLLFPKLSIFLLGFYEAHISILATHMFTDNRHHKFMALYLRQLLKYLLKFTSDLQHQCMPLILVLAKQQVTYYHCNCAYQNQTVNDL